MAVGTMRYWAAARAAAGIGEEPYDARTLADALRAAKARHGEQLAKVLDWCSYVVDDAPVGGRAHDSVELTEGGSVECLPPFAGGAAPQPKRSWATRPNRRAGSSGSPMIVAHLTRSSA